MCGGAYDSLNASATTKSKRLYDTCVATRAPNSKLEAETIRENAAKFRKMMAGIAGTKKKKAEDAKMAAMQERQFEELESKLRMVEQVRQENKQRERVLRANAAAAANNGKGNFTEVDF